MPKRMSFDSLTPSRIPSHRKRTYRQRMQAYLANAKARAGRNNMEFSATIDDLKFRTECPILGIPIEFNSGNRNNSPSIDRIDINKGYIPGNVRIISFKANRWKNDMTIDDAKKLVENWFNV